MLVRIVKMHFHKDKIDNFLINFDANKTKIRNTKGCQKLILYRDKKDQSIFFTYSYWETEKDLENYRKSQLFQSVWAKTKPLFSAKPAAWSLDAISDVLAQRANVG